MELKDFLGYGINLVLLAFAYGRLVTRVGHNAEQIKDSKAELQHLEAKNEKALQRLEEKNEKALQRQEEKNDLVSLKTFEILDDIREKVYFLIGQENKYLKNKELTKGGG